MARVACENRSLEWRIQRRDRPAFLDDSTTWNQVDRVGKEDGKPCDKVILEKGHDQELGR